MFAGNEVGRMIVDESVVESIVKGWNTGSLETGKEYNAEDLKGEAQTAITQQNAASLAEGRPAPHNRLYTPEEEEEEEEVPKPKRTRLRRLSDKV